MTHFHLLPVTINTVQSGFIDAFTMDYFEANPSHHISEVTAVCIFLFL